MAPFVYPPDLVTALKTSWPSWLRVNSTTVLPPDKDLLALLEIAYQVSVRKEEARSLQFRIVYAEPATLESSRLFPAAICFGQSRAFSTAEVLRLAPASDPARTMIGTSLQRGVLRIWGLVDTGAKRYRQLQGDLSGESAPDLPDALMITVFQPGGLQISYGDTVLLELVGGALQPQSASKNDIGVFGRGPVALFFEAQQQRFVRLFDQTDLEALVDLGDVMQEFGVLFERLLLEISRKGHGGALLVIPAWLAPGSPRPFWERWPIIRRFMQLLGNRRSILSKVLKLKYPCDDHRLWLALHGNLGAKMLYSKLAGFVVPETESAGEMKAACEARVDRSAEIHDVVSFIASLSEVDGAIVLTDDLRLCGFGAEILPGREVEFILTASDDLGLVGTKSRADERGTRHRSAYRFCAAIPEALAFVVSQDGDAKAIRVANGRVTVWPHILTNRLSGRPGFLSFVKALHAAP